MVTKQYLSAEKWEFRNRKDDQWYPAEIPGCIHLDLYKNKLIPDPLYGLNAKKLQWIEREDWEYCCIFEAADDILEYERIDLSFEGLDTYAEVNLNGKFLFASNNMFIPWKKEVKKYLRPGKNQLKVLLKSPFMTAYPKYRQLPYRLPANNDEHEHRVSPFTRKAPYMYGWDWGPRLLTSGIWKGVALEGWNEIRIENLNINTLLHSPREARLSAEVEFWSTDSKNLEIEIICEGEIMNHGHLVVHKGHVLRSFQFKMKEPELWWPRGFGQARLYDFEIIIRAGSKILDRKTVSSGIRKIELVREADQHGRSFMFRINGRNIFARGANIIPDDYFVSRISGKNYEEIVSNAIAGNMNMLRAWGGGIYEDDYFYELCDRNGIMVWQDFMFACGMYPSDKAFLKNVRSEIIHHVKRLRNHPSIVLWCGNNEVLEGYHTWGWKEDLGEYAGDAWASYKKIFLGLIPFLLKKLDRSRPYWPSSPAAGNEEKPGLHSGDFHYWDIVKEILPIDVFKENIGRFMSEYGFKSYPSAETIRSITGEENPDIHSGVMEFHQGWETGAELVEKNLEWYYREPRDFNMFLYLSQLLQAEAVKTAVEAHRRAKPFCMGTLYWQLNDCWPAATWSGIDYFGNWKAMHYFLKTSFKDILLSAAIEDDILKVFLIADIPEDIPCRILISMEDFAGKKEQLLDEEYTAGNEKADLVFSRSMDEIAQVFNPAFSLLRMKVLNNPEIISSNTFYFLKPSELDLRKSMITLDKEIRENRINLNIRSGTLVKNLYLENKGQPGFFSDNFFDLFPGEEKKISFYPRDGILKKDNFSYFSLYESYHKTRP